MIIEQQGTLSLPCLREKLDLFRERDVVSSAETGEEHPRDQEKSLEGPPFRKERDRLRKEGFDTITYPGFCKEPERSAHQLA